MQLDAINHRIRVHYIYIHTYTTIYVISTLTKYNKPNETTTRVILLYVHVCVSVYVRVCVYGPGTGHNNQSKYMRRLAVRMSALSCWPA